MSSRQGKVLGPSTLSCAIWGVKSCTAARDPLRSAVIMVSLRGDHLPVGRGRGRRLRDERSWLLLFLT